MKSVKEGEANSKPSKSAGARGMRGRLPSRETLDPKTEESAASQDAKPIHLVPPDNHFSLGIFRGFGINE